MNGLDLFSGIAGNSLGLRKYINTVAYCEQDRHAQAVLLSRMYDGSLSHAPIWDDVTTLTGDMLPKIVIIVAGFPCQDISVAGKGAGIAEGTRSGLFHQIMRLTDELKPRYLFLENVPAIRTRGLNIVLQELTQRGYDCRWTMLSAAEVGAKHKRERWFMLAHRRDESQRDVADAKQSNCGGGAAAPEIADYKGRASKARRAGVQPHDGKTCTNHVESGCKNVAYCDDKRLQGSSETGNISSQGKDTYKLSTGCNSSDSGRESKSRLDRMVDGISNWLDESNPNYLNATYWEKEPEDIPRVTQEKEQRVERIKRLGNAVVPLQAKIAFEYLMGIKA